MHAGHRLTEKFTFGLTKEGYNQKDSCACVVRQWFVKIPREDPSG